MGLFTKIIRFMNHKRQDEVQIVDEENSEEKELTGILVDPEEIDMEDELVRKRYVRSCLEQIADATDQIEQLENEYASVNAYLQDMEQIDALPKEKRERLAEQARVIDSLNVDREKYRNKTLHLKEETYRKMADMQEEVPDIIKKVRETEEYQEKIRYDLQKLEGEKHAYFYRKKEASLGLNNIRGMSVICCFSVFCCIGVLVVLQFAFELNVKIGYILTAIMAAFTLLFLYLKFQETQREFKVASNNYNKIILLQNKVKIRYVNNTNLLDYLYLKYEIKSANEMEKQWEAYIKEKELRAHMERTEENLDYHEQELISVLKEFHLFDPMVWLHQAIALYNPNEMVEVRHGLIVRRQKLRKQMEFNRENAEKAQKIIKDLVGEYPKYANEILIMVSDYEERNR